MNRRTMTWITVKNKFLVKLKKEKDSHPNRKWSISKHVSSLAAAKWSNLKFVIYSADWNLEKQSW